MLKLEKTSQLSGLTVRLRERERFLEPRLLKALAVALIFHCGALFLFQVTPFTFSSPLAFSPVRVQSDHSMQVVSTLVSAYFEEDGEPLPPSVALIPPLDWISFPAQSTLMTSLPLDPHALQNLEERLWPIWQEPLALKLEEPRIHLAISGDLAEVPLTKTDPLLNQVQSLSLHSNPTYVTYQVQVDEKTGEIFWYERLQSSGIREVDRLTESILLNLRFDIPDTLNLVEGTLDFIVLDTEIK